MKIIASTIVALFATAAFATSTPAGHAAPAAAMPAGHAAPAATEMPAGHPAMPAAKTAKTAKTEEKAKMDCTSMTGEAKTKCEASAKAH